METIGRWHWNTLVSISHKRFLRIARRRCDRQSYRCRDCNRTQSWRIDQGFFAERLRQNLIACSQSHTKGEHLVRTCLESQHVRVRYRQFLAIVLERGTQPSRSKVQQRKTQLYCLLLFAEVKKTQYRALPILCVLPCLQENIRVVDSGKTHARRQWLWEIHSFVLGRH